MAYTVKFKRIAEKQFSALPMSAKKGLAQRIDALCDDPAPHNAEKLAGQNGLWRMRWGDYRIIYEKPNLDGEITVLKIGHRREVYRQL